MWNACASCSLPSVILLTASSGVMSIIIVRSGTSRSLCNSCIFSNGIPCAIWYAYVECLYLSHNTITSFFRFISIILQCFVLSSTNSFSASSPCDSGSKRDKNCFSHSLLYGSLVRNTWLSLLDSYISVASFLITVPFPHPSIPSIAMNAPFIC